MTVEPPKLITRTKNAAEELASHLIDVSDVSFDGNTEEAHTFTFTFEGETYHVEVCAGVIHDAEQDELNDKWQTQDGTWHEFTDADDDALD